MDNNVPDPNAYDRSGRYESGLASLVKSLKWAFGLLLVAIIGMLIYFFTWGGYFSVEPQQAVIVLRFGKVLEPCYTSGGHWFLPYPVNRFVRIQTNQQFFKVDFIAPSAREGEFAPALTPGLEDYLITGDANIVHTSWTVGYRIANPVKYYTTLATPLRPVDAGRVTPDPVVTDADGFKGSRGPQTMLKNSFRSAVIQATGMFKVDELLASGQGRYSEQVQRIFTQLVEQADCGIVVENVTLNRIYPPGPTRQAFEAVTAASTTQSTLRNQAETYRVEAENDTLAKEAELLAAARTYRNQLGATIKAETKYFNSINEEYQKSASRSTVLMALYTAALSEAMEQGAMTGDKFVLGGNNLKRQVRILLSQELKNSQNTPKEENK
ncbi:MAG: hypothetical protein IKC77_05790 [Lentisphaeria bacterium]|nr:hypothetical protein [Lentisphaeria bacterium]